MPGNVNKTDDDERIVEIEMERLRPFHSHPFKVKDDQEMKDLIDSISRYGILTPLVVRPLPEGVYEIISGHRRKHAAQQLGFRKLPVIIRVLTDEDAVVSMVDSNMHRDKILPSEKAFAYKMKYEAMKQKVGRRKGSRNGHVNKGKKTVQIMGEEAGESPKQLQRYLKIAELIPELMQMLDQGEISFNPAFESAFLKPEEQQELVQAIRFVHSTPSVSQAQRMKKMSKEGTLTPVKMRYMLREELAPDGYVRAEDVKFKVEETGEIQKVYMKDDYTKISVSKQDMTTCKEIPGAHLTLFDKDGKVVEKWISTDKPHYITMLKPGRYMLREELAPDGYLRAEDVKFTVEETGDIQKVYMKDAYTKVQISKTDMVTKEEIPGAKLTVFDKDGKKVTTWTSTKKPHMIERLAPGQYTLREELAPDGYLRAEDVKFTVKETGEIQKVAMVDDYTKMQISKTDMVTKKELPGAKLTVFDSNNETVAKWTSGKEPHMIEKLKPGTYTLREETAPNGYEVAEDVKFTVKETGEIQKVAMVDAPKGTKKTTTSDGGGGSNTPKGSTSTGTRLSFSNPETGDTTDIVLWVLLLGLGSIFAAALWYAKKRVEEDTKKD